MTIKQQIEQHRSRLQQQKERLEKLTTFAEKHEELLSSLRVDVEINAGCDCIDFNWPAHDKTIEVIKAFPGNWDKSYHDATINYIMTFDGVLLRIYGGEPPPNCRVVEETIVVPEEITPATTKTIYKIVCD